MISPSTAAAILTRSLKFDSHTCGTDSSRLCRVCVASSPKQFCTVLRTIALLKALQSLQARVSSLALEWIRATICIRLQRCCKKRQEISSGHTCSHPQIDHTGHVHNFVPGYRKFYEVVWTLSLSTRGRQSTAHHAINCHRTGCWPRNESSKATNQPN